MRRPRPGVLLTVLVTVVAACGAEGEPPQAGDEVARGEQLFDANCAVCHGESGTGTASGPPLVHEIYEPNHHPDETFQRAVAEGAVAHHWDFGDMPPVEGLDSNEVEEIIAYVRDLQREAGIIR